MLNDSIRVFLTVVEKKSFSKAAKALFLTQPAVSFQIQMLEEYYGIRLFARGHLPHHLFRRLRLPHALLASHCPQSKTLRPRVQPSAPQQFRGSRKLQRHHFQRATGHTHVRWAQRRLLSPVWKCVPLSIPIHQPHSWHGERHHTLEVAARL